MSYVYVEQIDEERDVRFIQKFVAMNYQLQGIGNVDQNDLNLSGYELEGKKFALSEFYNPSPKKKVMKKDETLTLEI